VSTVTFNGPELGSPGWFKYWTRKGHDATIRELLVTSQAFNQRGEEIGRLTTQLLEAMRDRDRGLQTVLRLARLLRLAHTAIDQRDPALLAEIEEALG
jgi:hypothetical protein